MTCNESLAIRGASLLDLIPLWSWSRELDGTNEGKDGGWSRFSKSFVWWFVVWKQLVDYRGREGVTRRMADLHLIPLASDYGTLWPESIARCPICGWPSIGTSSSTVTRRG